MKKKTVCLEQTLVYLLVYVGIYLAKVAKT